MQTELPQHNTQNGVQPSTMFKHIVHFEKCTKKYTGKHILTLLQNTGRENQERPTQQRQNTRKQQTNKCCTHTATQQEHDQFTGKNSEATSQSKPRGWKFQPIRWLILITSGDVMDIDWTTWWKYKSKDQWQHRFYLVVGEFSQWGSVLVTHQFSASNYITWSSNAVTKLLDLPNHVWGRDWSLTG